MILMLSVQSTGKRGRRGGGAGREALSRKKVPRTDPGDGEGSLFEIVKSGKTALNVCIPLASFSGHSLQVRQNLHGMFGL